MELNVNDVKSSKATDKRVKVLAIVKESSRKAENKVVVVNARTDRLGRAYAIKGTERIVFQDSIRRRYR